MTAVAINSTTGVSERGGICEGVEMGEGVEVRVSGDDQVTITLSETETIDLLSIPGTVVLDLGQQETVQGSNQTYQDVRLERSEEERDIPHCVPCSY